MPSDVKGWDPLEVPRAGAKAFQVTPFMRLARAHAASTAGNALVILALAGSILLVDPEESRSRVAMTLALTMVPFALLAPLVGPWLDRLRGGRRWVIVGANALRAFVSLLLVREIAVLDKAGAGVAESVVPYVLAFVLLIADKSYHLAKSALVPTTVRSDEELVQANSLLTRLSGIAGLVGAVPGLIAMWIGNNVNAFGPGQGVMAVATVVFVVATVAGAKIPKTRVAEERTTTQERRELRGGGILLAASAMGLLRGILGFMTFLLTFWLQELQHEDRPETLTPEELAELSPEEWENLPPDVLANLSPEALEELPRDVLEELPPEVLENLSPEALEVLPRNVLDQLPPDVLENAREAAQEAATGGYAGWQIAVVLGTILGASVVGPLLGTVIAPALRRANVAEERIMQLAMGTIVVMGLFCLYLVSMADQPMLAAPLLVLSIGIGASSAKLAFDSIVQKDAPDANRGRAFARFETRFQLVWVVGAFIPVLLAGLILPDRLWVGFLGVTGCAAFALVSYLAGLKAMETGRPAPQQKLAKDLRQKLRNRSQGGRKKKQPPPAPGQTGQPPPPSQPGQQPRPGSGGPTPAQGPGPGTGQPRQGEAPQPSTFDPRLPPKPPPPRPQQDDEDTTVVIDPTKLH